jgi:hypothetical protein
MKSIYNRGKNDLQSNGELFVDCKHALLPILIGAASLWHKMHYCGHFSPQVSQLQHLPPQPAQMKK